jgi:hypothetical protein
MEPEDLVDGVDSKRAFLHFLKVLLHDKQVSSAQEVESPSSPYGPAAKGWENTSIEAFLAAILAWAESSDSLAEEPSWHAFARMFLSGKYYE